MNNKKQKEYIPTWWKRLDPLSDTSAKRLKRTSKPTRSDSDQTAVNANRLFRLYKHMLRTQELYSMTDAELLAWFVAQNSHKDKTMWLWEEVPSYAELLEGYIRNIKLK